ncbi:MAG: hypothetical protein ABI597_08680 [Gammaproteobacteria bacterium]
MNIRNFIQRTQKLGGACSEEPGYAFQKAFRVIKKLFPREAEEKNDVKTKLSLFVALYYTSKAIALCPKSKADKEKFATLNAKLEADWIEAMGGIVKCVEFLINHRQDFEKVADSNVQRVLCAQVFQLICLPVNDIKASDKEKNAKAEALLLLFKNPNRILQNLTNSQLMALRVGHRANAVVAKCLDTYFKCLGKSIAFMAQSSFSAAVLLFQNQNRISQQLTAPEVAKIINSHLDTIFTVFYNKYKQKPLPTDKIILLAQASAHAFILKKFLAATNFQSLNELSQNSEAAGILNKRGRFKIMIAVEVEIEQRAHTHDLNVTRTAITKAVVVPVQDDVVEATLQLDAAEDTELLDKAGAEDEEKVVASTSPVRLGGHRNSVWEEQNDGVIRVDADDMDELGVGCLVIDNTSNAREKDSDDDENNHFPISISKGK